MFCGIELNSWELNEMFYRLEPVMISQDQKFTSTFCCETVEVCTALTPTWWAPWKTTQISSFRHISKISTHHHQKEHWANPISHAPNTVPVESSSEYPKAREPRLSVKTVTRSSCPAITPCHWWGHCNAPGGWVGRGPGLCSSGGSDNTDMTRSCLLLFLWKWASCLMSFLCSSQFESLI